MKRVTSILLTIISPTIVLSQSDNYGNQATQRTGTEIKKSCSTHDESHDIFDVDLAGLEWTLDDFPDMNDVNSICDPDVILNMEEYDSIAQIMGLLNNVVLQHVPNKSRNSIENQFVFGTMEKTVESSENRDNQMKENGTCETETPIEIALVLVNKVC